MKRPAWAILLFLLAASAVPRAAAPSQPKLVVLLVVDQMRADYLERFAPHFGSRGFLRLEREGRGFKNACYSHGAASTGPGHVVLGSGAYPETSGVVGNIWYSFDERRPVTCVDGPVSAADPRRCAVPGEALPRGRRPKNPCWLEGGSLAERVKQRWPRARVVGVSLKDRAAILAVGRGADAAYWFDATEIPPAFVSSEFYTPKRELLERWKRTELPTFEARFDRAETTAAWEYSLKLPPRDVCAEDIAAAHTPLHGMGASFPHRVRSFSAVVASPLGDEMLERFTEGVVNAYRLGRNSTGQPDVLSVSFSSPDYVGHVYGPQSCEVADAFARLDRVLARFLDFLETTVGKRHVVVFLSSDHGVAPVVEVARARGLFAGRLFFFEEGAQRVGDLPPDRLQLELDLAPLRGEAIDRRTTLDRATVRSFQEPCFYLNREVLPSVGLPAWRARVRDRILAIEGVKDVYTSDDILAGKAPEAVRLGFREGRSGDLVVVAHPNWVFEYRKNRLATNHGQPYDYDVCVPLLVWGGEIRHQSIPERVDVARIAPTIAALLGLAQAGFSKRDPLPILN